MPANGTEELSRQGGEQLRSAPGSGESSEASSSRSTDSSATSLVPSSVGFPAQAPRDLNSAVSLLRNLCPPEETVALDASPRSMPASVPPDPGPSTPLRDRTNPLGIGMAGDEFDQATPRAGSDRILPKPLMLRPSGSTGLIYNSDPLLAGSALDTRFANLAVSSSVGSGSTPPRNRGGSSSNDASSPRMPPRSDSSSTLGSPTAERPSMRRSRSRHASRTGEPTSGMSYASRMSFSSLAALQGLDGWTDDTRVRDVVMTPTTGEWRAADVSRAGRKTPLPSDDEASDDDAESSGEAYRFSGATSEFAKAVSMASIKSMPRSPFDTGRLLRRDTARDPDDVSEEDGSDPRSNRDPDPLPRRFSAAALSVHSVGSFGSNGSIADVAVGPAPERRSSLRIRATPTEEPASYDETPTSNGTQWAPTRSPILGSMPPSPLPLDRVGPLDPRSYSAKTEARSIGSFMVASDDTGKGAYGSVRKARELDPGTDQPVGPLIIIKYIVKERIIADCWKKHKVLGPIPVEIHVLDHIRRVPYKSFLPADAPQSTLPVPLTGHPNIGSMLDFFEDQEHYYMVMPHFGNGQDLFDYVDAAPDGLPASEVKSIFGQVADALAFLHAMGVVHRDIKDENVILDGQGNVALIDFGSAAYIRSGDRRFDTFSGTLDFAAPEVLRSERYDGKYTDIWALGVLAYVLICGECPFWNAQEAMQGLGPDTRASAALAAKRAEGGPDGSPLDLAIDLVYRCLEVSADDRPTAQQICRHRLYAGAAGWSGHRGWLVRTP